MIDRRWPMAASPCVAPAIGDRSSANEPVRIYKTVLLICESHTPPAAQLNRFAEIVLYADSGKVLPGFFSRTH